MKYLNQIDDKNQHIGDQNNPFRLTPNVQKLNPGEPVLCYFSVINYRDNQIISNEVRKEYKKDLVMLR